MAIYSLHWEDKPILLILVTSRKHYGKSKMFDVSLEKKVEEHNSKHKPTLVTDVLARESPSLWQNRISMTALSGSGKVEKIANGDLPNEIQTEKNVRVSKRLSPKSPPKWCRCCKNLHHKFVLIMVLPGIYSVLQDI